MIQMNLMYQHGPIVFGSFYPVMHQDQINRDLSAQFFKKGGIKFLILITRDHLPYTLINKQEY